MANYCSKCLSKTKDGEDLCVDCLNKINLENKKVETKKSFEPKTCFHCGKEVNYWGNILSSYDKDKNYTCFACNGKMIQEEIDKKKQPEIEERYNKMKEGRAFINISRELQLSNGFSDMEVIICNSKYQEKKTFILSNGSSGLLELADKGRFYLYAKVMAWPRSKELSIDVDYGETVFIEMKTKSARGPLGAATRLLLKEEMVFCKIIKREIVDGDNIKVLELT